MPTAVLELLVISVVHLNGVTHGPGGDQEGHHQHERIERQANQMDEAEAPEGRDQAGDRRSQGTAPIVEIHPTQHPLDAIRHHENEEDVARVVVDPSVQPRLSGHVHLGVGIAEGFHDMLVHLIEHTAVVQTALDEVGPDERRLVVERDEQSVDVFRVVHDAPDLGGFLVCFHLAQHHGCGPHGATGCHLQVAHRAMCDGVDLIVIDAVDLIEAPRHAPDLVQRLRCEDAAFLHLQHHHDVVGAAERTREAIVDLDVGVVLRQQIAKTRHELELECPVDENAGDENHQNRHGVAIVDQLVAQPIEEPLVLRHIVVECHPYLPTSHARPTRPRLAAPAARPQDADCVAIPRMARALCQ